jgi:hypothetical protein
LILMVCSITEIDNAVEWKLTGCGRAFTDETDHGLSLEENASGLHDCSRDGCDGVRFGLNVVISRTKTRRWRSCTDY